MMRDRLAERHRHRHRHAWLCNNYPPDRTDEGELGGEAVPPAVLPDAFEPALQLC
jgi:hypothetical protein